jgi:hypothetical protein
MVKTEFIAESSFSNRLHSPFNFVCRVCRLHRLKCLR